MNGVQTCALPISFGLEEEASVVEYAIDRVIEKGFRTEDIYIEGNKLVGTKAMGDKICSSINEIVNENFNFSKKAI